MSEIGECSSSATSLQEIWAKLVPSESRYSDVDICSNEVVVCSEITSSSPCKREWCKIIRNSDLCSASLQNKSSNMILVDGIMVNNEDVVDIKSGTEIILDPERAGYLSYRFKVIPGQESCKQQLKISIDIEHAKCCFCLNIWHDVVTVSPCLHNFCNGCLSEWLRRSKHKRTRLLCPHCRAVIQVVRRNHYLHHIEQSILQADASLRRDDEEVALLDSYASIKSNPQVGIQYYASLFHELMGAFNDLRVHTKDKLDMLDNKIQAIDESVRGVVSLLRELTKKLVDE